MKKQILRALVPALFLGAVAVHGAPEGKAEKRVMTPTERVAAARLVAAAMPGKALKDWMTAGAFNRWNDTFGPLNKADGSGPLLEDFFAHALLLKGPQTAQSGIYAFYNPLQDNLFLFQTDNVDRVPRIEDFVFMTGGRFRGETPKKGEYPQAVAPTREDLDAVLQKNVSAVAARFHKMFPDSEKNFSLASLSAADDPEQVCANAFLRLALLRRFVKDEAQADTLKAGEAALLLWKGEEKALKDFFSFPADDAYPAKVYAALPARVKQGMLPVLYFKDKKQETLLGFASRVLPEMLVLVKFRAQGKPLFIFLPLSEKFVCDVK